MLTSKQVLEESALLFNIPIDEQNIRYAELAGRAARTPFRIQGFAAGDDGTFWIIDPAHRLLHYSAEGKILGSGTLPSDLSIHYLVARGSDAWVLAFSYSNENPEPATLFRYSQSGEELARYTIPDDTPPRAGPLYLGEGAQILMFREMTSGPQLWQVLDKSGVLDWKPLESYTRGGRLYSARLDSPDDHFNRSASVSVGDIKFGITLTRPNMYLSGACICHVNPDGSFYLFTQEWDRTSRGYYPPRYQGVLHYSAEGKPLGRVPEEFTGDGQPGSGVWANWGEVLALRADGTIYLLKSAPGGSGQSGDATHFEVRTLKFGP